MFKNLSKFKRILWAMVICICLCVLGVFGFELSLRNAARQLAVARASIIVNNAINVSLYRDELAVWYEDLVTIERSDIGQIQSVIIDGYALNQLAGQIAKSVESIIETDSKESITISLSSVFGTAAIGIAGPRFTVECRALPAVNVDIESKFEQAGINQTKHSLTANIYADVRFLVAGRIVAYENKSSLLLCETIIVGIVPDTYLNGGSNGGVLPLLPLSP